MSEADLRKILAGEFDLEIPNFEKWNPTKEGRRKWIKLSVDWWRDPKVSLLSASDRTLWVQLLSLRGTCKGLLRNLRVTSLGPQMNLRGTSLVPSLVKLAKSKLIILRNSSLEENREEEIRREEKRRDIEKAPAEPVHPPKDSSPLSKEKTTEKPPKEKETIPDLLAIWNENRGALSEATAMSDHRKKSWKARWHDKPDLDYWKQVVIRMSKSEFCRGEVNSWKATIDFLLRPETHIKVMEGTYDGTKATKTPNKATGNKDLWDRVERGEI